jgi:uncharacterized protein (DUF1778 family)
MSHLGDGTEERSMEQEKKVKLLVYATEDERTRIKMAAAKLHMSMSQLILDSVLEQVGSIEKLEQKGGEGV